MKIFNYACKNEDMQFLLHKYKKQYDFSCLALNVSLCVYSWLAVSVPEFWLSVSDTGRTEIEGNLVLHKILTFVSVA